MAEKELKVWIQDLGWRGCVVVIAATENEARDLMDTDEFRYDDNKPVESFPIKPGLIYGNLGDA